MLRQLMNADSANALFVMPRSSDPVLAGPAAADAHQSSIAALRADLAGVASHAPAAEAFDAAEAAEGMPADLLTCRALKQLNSFDKWDGSDVEQTEAAPGAQQDPRLLRPLDSLERFWKGFAFDDEPLDAVLPEQGGLPEPPVPTPDMGAGLIGESDLDYVLAMLEEPPAPYAPPGGECLARVSLKMFDRGPQDLGAPDLRQRLENALGGASVAGAYLQVRDAVIA